MQMGTGYQGVPPRGDAPVTNRHQRWTQTSINDLRSGVAGGVDIEVIADALGRTVDEIRAMAFRLRLRVAVRPSTL